MDETIGKETSIISLREAMQRYAEVLERSRVKPQSRKNYRGWVERFRSYHREHGGFEVRRCRTGDIRSFGAGLQNPPLVDRRSPGDMADRQTFG